MKNILSFFKKFLPKSKVGGDARPHATRDWHVLLVILLLALIASVLWNIWFFNIVANEEEMVNREGGQGALETYPAGTIQEVFEKRGAMEASYRSGFQFVDPSK